MDLFTASNRLQQLLVFVVWTPLLVRQTAWLGWRRVGAPKDKSVGSVFRVYLWLFAVELRIRRVTFPIFHWLRFFSSPFISTILPSQGWFSWFFIHDWCFSRRLVRYSLLLSLFIWHAFADYTIFYMVCLYFGLVFGYIVGGSRNDFGVCRVNRLGTVHRLLDISTVDCLCRFPRPRLILKAPLR